MAPYVGEIRMFAGNFEPSGWMFCDGRLLPISEYETLFDLIGTQYGGDGESTFGLPDLQGRLPVHQGALGGGGTNYMIGEMAGVEQTSLSQNQIPAHTHVLVATTNAASSTAPGNQMLALVESATITPYGSDDAAAVMHASSVSPIGGSQAHTNLQPFLCISFIVSLFGIFPSPT
jgi:microcystin-dependent protein